jgi:hypothetical protein
MVGNADGLASMSRRAFREMLRSSASSVMSGVGGSARRRLAALLALGVVLTACAAGAGGSSTPGSAASGSAGPSASGADEASPSGDAESAPMRMTFPELLADAEQLIGQRIEVTGTAFFLAKCPPPGASPTPVTSPTTGCVLQGYLAAPDRGVLTASDLPEALPLAEDGHLVSCDEGTESPPACGDWLAATRYTVIGIVERQVLGGRETTILQLNVLGKTAAS